MTDTFVFLIVMTESITAVAFLLSSFYGAGQTDNHAALINAMNGLDQATTTTKTIRVSSVTSTSTMESYLRQEYADTPILVDIARCESEFRQYNKDGTVLRGRAVRDDVGVMQINEHYHAAMAKKLGIDIYSIDGNIEYAKHIYQESGTAPWSASKPCWSKTGDLARK